MYVKINILLLLLLRVNDEETVRVVITYITIVHTLLCTFICVYMYACDTCLQVCMCVCVLYILLHE
jgi:hypothetical protein